MEFGSKNQLGVVNIVGDKRYRFSDWSNGYELPYYVSCHRTLLGVMKRYIEGGRKPL